MGGNFTFVWNFNKKLDKGPLLIICQTWPGGEILSKNSVQRPAKTDAFLSWADVHSSLF